MTRYLFAGPSLPDAAELTAGTGLVVLPPVAGGDLLRLRPRRGDIVGIVDGYFHQRLAVRHKEILSLLDDGVHVLGAASIGALRAAELDGFGMHGVGGIYRDYRDGVLEADDEVVLLHGPAESGYRSLSEPLVNIRATLAAAEAGGLLRRHEREGLVGPLGRIPYRERDYRTVVDLATRVGLLPARVDALRAFCAGRAVNRKRDDAVELVARLWEPPAHGPAFDLSVTAHLASWRLAARGGGAGRTGDLTALRVCQLFASDYPSFHRRLVLDHIARECRATCAAAPGEEAAETAIAHGEHRGFYRRSSGLEFLDGWLTAAERSEPDVDVRLERFLVRASRTRPGLGLDEVAVSGLSRRTVDTARRVAVAAAEMNSSARAVVGDVEPGSLSSRRIVDWLVGRWDTTPEDIELRALDRGFGSVREMVNNARPFYLLAKYNPELVVIGMTTGT